MGVFLRAFEVKRGETLVVTICPNIWTRRLFAREPYSKLFTRLRDDQDFRNDESCKKNTLNKIHFHAKFYKLAKLGEANKKIKLIKDP